MLIALIILAIIAKVAFLVWWFLIRKREGLGGPRPEMDRSPRWPAVRQAHLAKEPVCQVCGTRDELQVHHIKPYHLFPSLELDRANLLTLCEGGNHNCHLLFGHLNCWMSWNEFVRADAAEWRNRIRNRP